MGQFLLFWEIWLTLRNCKYVVGILAIYHLCLSIFSCTWNTVLKIAINKHYLKIVIQSQRLTFEYNFCYQLIIFFDLNVFMYLKYLMMLAIVTLPSIFALYASIFSFQISNVGICMATSWLGLFHQSSEIWQSFTICTFFFFFPYLFSYFFHKLWWCIFAYANKWQHVSFFNFNFSSLIFLYIEYGFDVIWASLLDIRSQSIPPILCIYPVMY